MLHVISYDRAPSIEPRCASRPDMDDDAFETPEGNQANYLAKRQTSILIDREPRGPKLAGKVTSF